MGNSKIHRCQGSKDCRWSVRRCEIVEAFGLLFLIVGLFLLGFTPLDLKTTPWVCLLLASLSFLSLGAWFALTSRRHDPRPPGWRTRARRPHDPMITRSWNRTDRPWSSVDCAHMAVIGTFLGIGGGLAVLFLFADLGPSWLEFYGNLLDALFMIAVAVWAIRLANQRWTDLRAEQTRNERVEREAAERMLEWGMPKEVKSSL